MPTPEQIIATFRAYADAVATQDRAALLDCFTKDAVQVDPYPSAPNVGPEAIAGFFDATWSMAERMELTVGHFIVAGDRGAFPFTVRTWLAGGSAVEVDVIDVITVADDGRIRELTAYVDMAGMRAVDPAG